MPTRRSVLAGVAGLAIGGTVVGAGTHRYGETSTVRASTDRLTVADVQATVDDPPAAIPIIAEGGVAYTLDRDVDQVRVDLFVGVDGADPEPIDYFMVFNPPRTGDDHWSIDADLYEHPNVEPDDFDLADDDVREMDIELVIEASVVDNGETLETMTLAETMTLTIQPTGVHVDMTAAVDISVE